MSPESLARLIASAIGGGYAGPDVSITTTVDRNPNQVRVEVTDTDGVTQEFRLIVERHRRPIGPL